MCECSYQYSFHVYLRKKTEDTKRGNQIRSRKSVLCFLTHVIVFAYKNTKLYYYSNTDDEDIETTFNIVSI